jgi:hypothetical protein
MTNIGSKKKERKIERKNEEANMHQKGFGEIDWFPKKSNQIKSKQKSNHYTAHIKHYTNDSRSSRIAMSLGSAASLGSHGIALAG